MGPNDLSDVLGTVGQHDQQFGARLHENPQRRVQSQAAQFLAQRAVTRFARRQHILPTRLAQAGRKARDLRRLARPFDSLKRDKQDVLSQHKRTRP